MTLGQLNILGHQGSSSYHLKQNFILNLQKNLHELLAAWRHVRLIYTDYDSKYAAHNQQSKAVMYVCMYS